MKILVACEESQALTIELRKSGHEAYSCDIIECSGGHPEWHIRWDALALANGNCSFMTTDGELHSIQGKWDMIIAFPPCTDLASSGSRHFSKKRADGRQQRSIDFFMAFADADCERIAIENPVGIMSTKWRKPDQIIQPWQFALTEEEKTEKSTCLWLKGLNPLVPRVTERPEVSYHEWVAQNGKKKRQTLWYYKTRSLPHHERGRVASKTFPGIAKAMAGQWAGQAKEVDSDASDK